MKCVRCGTDNIEEAKFCKKCGKRLDGNAVCSNCGKLTPADGEYCIYCGANRNATYEDNHPEGIKTFVSESSSLESNNFSTKKETKKASNIQEKVIVSTKRNRILQLCSSIAGGMTILVCLIFTFLLGVSANVGGASISAEGYNIYYFFSDAFTTLSDTSHVYSYGLIGPILGLITVILGIIGIIVVTIFGVREFIWFVQKKNSDMSKYSVISFFTYLGFVALYMINMASIVSSGGVDVALCINGATIAGIVLGAIFMLSSIVLNLIIKGGVKQNIKSYLINAISTGLFTIIAIVCVSLLGQGIITVSASGVSTSSGVFGYSVNMFNIANSVYLGADELWSDFIMNFVANTIFIIVLFILAISFIFSLIQNVKNSLTNFGFDKKKNSLIYGIICGSSVLLFGVFDLIFSTVISSYFITGEKVIAVPIVLIVLGLLMDACVITSYLLQKKYNNNSSAENLNIN